MEKKMETTILSLLLLSVWGYRDIGIMENKMETIILSLLLL